MKYWDKSREYKRIMEILDDYWLTEPNEDYVKIKMAFIKGKEFQTKHITWRRNPEKGKLKIEPVNCADAMQIMISVATDLNEFVKAKSEELKIDKREVWEHIEYYADMYFINRELEDTKNDED